MNITDLRTGEYDNTTVSVTGGFYAFDLSGLPSPYQDGDSMRAVAWFDPLSGENQTIITTVGPYDWFNVTLESVVIPEFPTLLIPISGMLLLIVVVGTVRRRRL